MKLSSSERSVMQVPALAGSWLKAFTSSTPAELGTVCLALGFVFIFQTFFHGSWSKKREISGLHREKEGMQQCATGWTQRLQPLSALGPPGIAKATFTSPQHLRFPPNASPPGHISSWPHLLLAVSSPPGHAGARCRAGVAASEPQPQDVAPRAVLSGPVTLGSAVCRGRFFRRGTKDTNALGHG